MATTAFGALFKSLRMRTGLSLREFCRQNSLDWGNVSKLERGLFPPPQRPETIERYARALGLQKGSDDWLDFCDAARVGAGRLPESIANDEELLARLPVFFRTVRPLTPEKIDELIRMVREA